MKQKYKNRFPDQIDPSDTSIQQTLQNSQDPEGSFQRDKFGRRIIRSEIKSVKMIHPEPPVVKQKTEEERNNGIFLDFLYRNGNIYKLFFL